MVQVNCPFFGIRDSDVHAEQHAVATAASKGVCLSGATAYISMPPCKVCFMNLVNAGVKRIVSRKRVEDVLRTWLDSDLNKTEVTFLEVADTPESKMRLLSLVKSSGLLDEATVKEERKRRKEMDKADKAAKKVKRDARNKERERKEAELKDAEKNGSNPNNKASTT